MPNASTTLIGGRHEQTPGHPQTNRAAEVRFLWRLMADTDLSATAKCVAATLLLKFHNAKSSEVQSRRCLHRQAAGLARRTVFYAIVELKDAGWITVESTKGGSASHTNQYGFDFKGVKSAHPRPVRRMHPYRCTRCTSARNGG